MNSATEQWLHYLQVHPTHECVKSREWVWKKRVELLTDLESFTRLNRLEHLKGLERLNRLEHLKRLEMKE